MGRLPAVEHDRSEDSHEQTVAEQAEPHFHEEPVHPEREDYGGSAREEVEGSRDTIDPGRQSGVEGEARHESHSSHSPEGVGPSEGGPGESRGRSRGRGRGRRVPPRDRRMPDRNRRREARPHYQGQGSHEPGRLQEEGRGRERAESHLPPETRSLLEQVRGEVEQVREVLEGVLRDLEHVADQLTKAEHEKDIAEAEIEQLRESLRRLHR